MPAVEEHRPDPPGRRRPTTLLAVPLGLLASGVVVASASSAAFTATTSTALGTFSAAELVLTSSSTGTHLFQVSDLVPGGAPTSTCVVVTYTGTVDVDVSLYAQPSVAGGPFQTVDDATLDGGDDAHDLEDQLVVSVSAKQGSHAGGSGVCDAAMSDPGVPDLVLRDGSSATALTSPVALSPAVAALTTRTGFTTGLRLPGVAKAVSGVPSATGVITYRVSYELPDAPAAVVYPGGRGAGTANDGAQGDTVALVLVWEARSL